MCRVLALSGFRSGGLPGPQSCERLLREELPLLENSLLPWNNGRRVLWIPEIL